MHRHAELKPPPLLCCYRSRLAKLLRFHTSKSPEKLTSLDEYISRMKEDQKQIYFIAGSSKEEVAKSPFLEKLVKKVGGLQAMCCSMQADR